MSWADVYLTCFAVGFAFSFLSFFLGGIDWHFPAHWHLPFAPQEVHAPDVHTTGHGHAGNTPHVSVINAMTLAAFLAWFGGTGYLLTRFSTVRFVGGLLLSVVSGILAASVIFLFLTRVLISKEENLDPRDYEMVGVLGRITSSVRGGGTGEIVYSQAGTRRVCGARSEDGSPIAKGSEVLVTRYERGIAYVRRWQELVGEEQISSVGPP